MMYGWNQETPKTKVGWMLVGQRLRSGKVETYHRIVPLGGDIGTSEDAYPIYRHLDGSEHVLTTVTYTPVAEWKAER